MNKWRYWNCFGLSITSHWIFTIRWLFAPSSGRFDEFKVFLGIGVVFLGLPFLSSDVDLTVEGFFCFLLWLHWLFGFTWPVLNGVLMRLLSLVDGMFGIFFLRIWLGESFDCYGNGLVELFDLILESQIFFMMNGFGILNLVNYWLFLTISDYY